MTEHIKSRAVVFEQMGAPLTIKEILVAPAKEREVRVKITAAGLCHSDLNAIEGHTRYDLPMVMGHEGVGRVESVGPNVTKVKPDDRVVLSWAAFCGDCYFCDRGETELCSTVAWPRGKGFLPDYSTRFTDKDGSEIFHFAGVSSFSEYTVLHESGCVVIDDDIEDEVAATVGCSVVTGVGSVLNTAKLPVGATVAVIGAGSIGLSIIQAARISGAKQIIVLERDRTKWPLAHSLGAGSIFDNSEAMPIKDIEELTEGIGLDFVFDAVGSTETIKGAVKLARRGGTIVLVGSPHSLLNVELPMVDFHLEKKLLGSLYGSSNPALDIPRVLDFYRERSLKLTELNCGSFKMTDINDAMEALKKSGGKYLIEI